MRTPVYIKLDAPEQLLIAKGVCRQLCIIKYQPSIVDEKHRSKDGAKRGKRSQNRDQDYPVEGKRCKVSGGEIQEGKRCKVSGGEMQEGKRCKVSGGEVQVGEWREMSGDEVQEGENGGGESPGGVADDYDFDPDHDRRHGLCNRTDVAGKTSHSSSGSTAPVRTRQGQS